MPEPVKSMAVMEAEAADKLVLECLQQKRNFVLEAGAGAGKTHSLIGALRWLIKERESELILQQAQIACITYTNVAKSQIELRTDRSPLILADTIHAFCWSMIGDFQPELKRIIASENSWQETFKTIDCFDLERCKIAYDLGFQSVEKPGVVSISHDDVITLTASLMKSSKLRALMEARYPVILIDEYQDTNKEFFDALKLYFLDTGAGPLVGLFGDYWQKIYGDGCGSVSGCNLKTIRKHCNFRSSAKIVSVLNKMRPELTQEPANLEPGQALVFHTNGWQGTRRSGNHWQGDLPQLVAHEALEKVKLTLSAEGWNFQPSSTKILMLTHNVLAEEQDYSDLAKCFKYKDSFVKKENKIVEFFIDQLEPYCEYYEAGNYGGMFASIRTKYPAIRCYDDKVKWQTEMDRLLCLKADGKVRDVLDHLRKTGKPALPGAVLKLLTGLEVSLANNESSLPRNLEEIGELLDVPYSQVSKLGAFLRGHSLFSTKHSTKGDEYENVLVVAGRGWNHYNFDRMLDTYKIENRGGQQESFERSRNLFYVACSRAKSRLAVLFTQTLCSNSLRNLEDWYGREFIRSVY